MMTVNAGTPISAASTPADTSRGENGVRAAVSAHNRKIAPVRRAGRWHFTPRVLCASPAQMAIRLVSALNGCEDGHMDVDR